MRWKWKARLQNLIARLPSSVSYAVYYWLQRNFGGLRHPNPVSRLTAGVRTWKRIQQNGGVPQGKVFFEVGTGRDPLVPLAFWLMGAEKTISVDLNPYLKEELILESLDYISENRSEIQQLFGDLLDQNRLDQLLEFNRTADRSAADMLRLCRIEYQAPADAAHTDLADESIDFHTSYTVFEHIPAEILRQILEEGNRITRADGMFVHRIDYSDHFSHSDPNICSINFLQYGDAQWDKIAGNRYMYMNRLRHDDVVALFESSGQCIVDASPDIDPRAQQALQQGLLSLDDRFQSKTPDTLSITGAWMVTRRCG